MFFDDLIEVDLRSDSYANFALFAWDVLLDIVSPMPNQTFWPHVESVNWPAASDDIGLASENLARRLSLTDSASLSLAALDWTGELDSLWQTDLGMLGEDSKEDFLYHLVGLGRTFVESLSNDPSPAIEIANDHAYVESFRYVVDGCRACFPLKDYVDAFLSNDRFARSHSHPRINTMRKVDDNTPGVVVRVDANSYEVVTPTDSRTIAIP